MASCAGSYAMENFEGFLAQIFHKSSQVVSLLVQNALHKLRSVATPKGLPSVLTSRVPVLYLCLTPHLQDRNSSLQVRMSTYLPRIEADTRLLSMPFVIGNIPTSNYSLENPVQAFDSSGSVALRYEDQYDASPASRVWYPNRSISGEVSFDFTAHPGLDFRSGSGGRIDLREDQGGLIGNFMSIVPRLDPVSRDKELIIYARWNLPKSAEGPTAAWTWGDGLSTKHVGTIDSAIDALFAVGPLLQSMARNVTLPRGREETMSMYWFGEAPYDPIALFEKLFGFFAGMASFFNDTGPFYKIFIRRSTVCSYGGSAFYRTFIVEYYPGMVWDELDMMFLLSHEMVHNWPQLGRCTETAPTPLSLALSPTELPCDNDTNWFDEGIAVYYGTILPYRLGVCNASTFLNELNSNAQAYYTSPAINVSNREASERPWSSFDIVRIPYYRGFVYLLAVDAEIHHGSNGTHSLDDVVLELLARRSKGEDFAVDVFLSLIEPYVPNTVAGYQAMASARQLQIPANDSMASAGLLLQRVNMPPFEPGFGRAADFSIGYVKAGSRADEAGLKVGDRTVQMSDFNWVAARLDRNVTMRVLRTVDEGEEVEIDITFWPRARHTVEGYQWVESTGA